MNHTPSVLYASARTTRDASSANDMKIAAQVSPQADCKLLHNLLSRGRCAAESETVDSSRNQQAWLDPLARDLPQLEMGATKKVDEQYSGPSSKGSLQRGPFGGGGGRAKSKPLSPP